MACLGTSRDRRVDHPRALISAWGAGGGGSNPLAPTKERNALQAMLVRPFSLCAQHGRNLGCVSPPVS